MPKLISDQLVLRNRAPQALSGSLPSQSSPHRKTNFWWQHDIRLNREGHGTPLLSPLLISRRCASEVHTVNKEFGDMHNRLKELLIMTNKIIWLNGPETFLVLRQFLAPTCHSSLMLYNVWLCKNYKVIHTGNWSRKCSQLAATGRRSCCGWMCPSTVMIWLVAWKT